MKKVLAICLGIWLTILIFVLVGRLYNALGLLVVVLSLVVILMGLTLYDIIIQTKIRNLIVNDISNIRLKEGLLKLDKIAKMPLTQMETDWVILTYALAYIYQGDLDKAKDKLSAINPALTKGRLRLSYYLISKDLTLIEEDKEAYQELNAKQKKECHEFHQGDFLSEERASMFYLGLTEGFIDPETETEAMDYFKNAASQSKADGLFYRYAVLLEESLRLENLVGLGAFVQDAGGTCFESKAEKLKKDDPWSGK